MGVEQDRRAANQHVRPEGGVTRHGLETEEPAGGDRQADSLAEKSGAGQEMATASREPPNRALAGRCDGRGRRRSRIAP